MKIIRRILAALSFLLILSSCKTEIKHQKWNTFQMSDFNQTKILEGVAKPIYGVAKPVNIRIIPKYNLLLVLESTAESYLAKAYTLDSLKLLKQFAKNGRQKDGQLMAYSLRYSSGLNKIYINDLVKGAIYGYSIDSILDPASTCKPVSIVTLTDSSENAIDAFKPDIFPKTNKIVDLRLNYNKAPVSMFNFYTSTGKFIGHNGKFPEYESSAPVNSLNDIFTGGITLNEDGSKILYNYYNFDILDIFDSSGNLLHRTQGPDQIYPAFMNQYIGQGILVRPAAKSMFAYSGQIRIKGNRIFALYNGKDMKTNDYHDNELFEFNDELTPITRYKLNLAIFDFDIDWTNKKIYGLSHKTNNQVIVFSF